MEYVDLVNKIVAAEHSAQEIAREVKEKQDSLDADLKLEVGKLREDYFARAKHRTSEQLAAMANMPVEEVKAAVKQYEAEKVILGYQAIVDWNTTDRDAVTALIEVKVTPQREEGFDRIAERIYQYDEVEALYLMSGAFDFTVIISGRTLREVAGFVSDRLAPLEGVTGTATHFILKKYKEKHLIFEKQAPGEREFIFV